MARALLFVSVVTLGCGGGNAPLGYDPDAGTDGDDVSDATPSDGASPDARPDDVPPDAGPVDYPYSDLDVGCAPIFRQSIVPEYHLTIAPDHWAAMQYELMNPQFTPGGSIIEPPYHPAELHIVEGDQEHDPPGVMIRINGNTSWLQAIRYDADPKAQFMIAFNEVESDARFQGLRKLKLDMPRSDWTFLQQRVALAWMRGRAGIPAQCANSARLFINGELYGLYTNVERQDKGFLTRNYGTDDNDGDLWKAGRDIKTNEEDFSWTRISAFWDTEDLAGIDALVDLDASMIAWASEAVIGDSDGYNQGRPNFMLYDRPANHQFVWLVNDLDTTLDEDFLPPETTPVLAPTPDGEARWERDWHHYLIALNDPDGPPRYVQALAQQLPKLDPAEIAGWIDAWSAQIHEAAEDDPRKPFSMTQHASALGRMKSFAPARASYLEDWLACWETGGVDADGDGFDMCHDCDDHDFAQSPAAIEACDEIDNNCDGRVDNLSDASMSCSQPTEREVMWRRVLNDVKAHRRTSATE